GVRSRAAGIAEKVFLVRIVRQAPAIWRSTSLVLRPNPDPRANRFSPRRWLGADQIATNTRNAGGPVAGRTRFGRNPRGFRPRAHWSLAIDLAQPRRSRHASCFSFRVLSTAPPPGTPRGRGG